MRKVLSQIRWYIEANINFTNNKQKLSGMMRLYLYLKL